jgi:putative ABC transport system permease protein
MLHHFLLIAWRTLIRNKLYSLVNITGFAVAIACSFLLVMYSWHEITYDHFHEKKDRIFLVGVSGRMGDEEWTGGWSVPPLGPELNDYFPEIESFTRLCYWFDEVMVVKGENKYIEEGIIGADSSIFNVFTIPFEKGDPSTALIQPNSIVITSKAARKYFGEEDPLGKTLNFHHFFNECKVTGVVEDYPDNSHFDFKMLLSLSTLKNIDFDFEDSWQNHTFSTYVLLHDQAKPVKVADKFDQFLKDRMGPYLVKTYQHSGEDKHRRYSRDSKCY